MHPTYKHLEDRIRLAGLTLGQWSQLVVCALAAYLLAKVLPLPGSWSVSVALTIAGLPAAASIALMQQDFDVAVLGRAAIAGRRGPVRFRAGDPARASGTAAAPDLTDGWCWLWD